MKSSLLILSIFALGCTHPPPKATVQQTDHSSFRLNFFYFGLGPDMNAQDFPIIRIYGDTMAVTTAKPGYDAYAVKPTDTSTYHVTLKPSTVDTILALIKPIKDTQVFKSNPDIIDGGGYIMNIYDKVKKLQFWCTNTGSRTSIAIFKLLNPYLRPHDTLYVTELEKSTEACRKAWERRSGSKETND